MNIQNVPLASSISTKFATKLPAAFSTSVALLLIFPSLTNPLRFLSAVEHAPAADSTISRFPAGAAFEETAEVDEAGRARGGVGSLEARHGDLLMTERDWSDVFTTFIASLACSRGESLNEAGEGLLTDFATASWVVRLRAEGLVIGADFLVEINSFDPKFSASRSVSSEEERLLLLVEGVLVAVVRLSTRAFAGAAGG